jgi:gliding motility-associated-like protein
VWTPNVGLNNDTLANVIATPFATTVYTVTVSNETCSPTARTVTVVVNALPLADAGPDLVTFAGVPVTLDGTASGNAPLAYSWTPPTTLDCPSCEDPVATLSSNASFEFLVTDVNGCAKTDSVNVRVLDRCSGSLVYVPNTFTPNGDGVNDLLYVRSFGVKEIKAIRIFDRWGSLLFENTDPAIGWDGTFDGTPLDPAVFVYTIEGVCLNDEDFITSGNVAIVK